MDKHTFLSIGIGSVLGFMLVLLTKHILFVLGMVLSVLALRWLFSQW
ncbi:hypothetical protein [Acinetobacter baumannii]|nr:hypothetical protein [Acinetobacter baumannii]MCJ9474473.1 hypothetical protein [Acinetobacter baumannii]SSS24642.1 Uncharacterised protein [Acinetobacter baumannii]SSS37865.1 Uncharacterised protein [Acinetobacter baumannii]SSS98291.1 Uncharacterised protein [Acinetobacter baumannii]SST34182.1 Uncharacterised protein [Acinetobacter baumannii]